MSGKAGLIPIQKLVVRNGQSFMTTVYVNPKQAHKINQASHVQVPDFKLNTIADLEAVRNKVNKTKDPAEREVLKDEFMKHLEQKGITWTKNANAGINYMRALMAAKDSVTVKGNITNQPTQPKPSNPQPAQPNHIMGQPIAKEEARKLVKQLAKTHGTNNLMAAIKKAGLTWTEHKEQKINRMRAMMALREHLEKGGTLDGKQSGQPKPSPTPTVPKTKPEPKTDPNAPKDGTLEHVYYKASPKARAIGLVTGMIPQDDDTENYLLQQIKDGKFEIEDNPQAMTAGNDWDQFGFPKGMDFALRNNTMEKLMKTGGTREAHFGFEADEMYSGHPDEQAYKDYKEARFQYNKNYTSFLLHDSSVPDLAATVKQVDLLSKHGMSLEDVLEKTPAQNREKLKENLTKFASMSDSELERVWDELEMEKYFNRSALYREDDSLMNTMMQISMGRAFNQIDYTEDYLKKELGFNHLNYRSPRAINEAVAKGTISKKQVMKALLRAVNVSEPHLFRYTDAYTKIPIKSQYVGLAGYMNENSMPPFAEVYRAQSVIKDRNNDTSAFSSKELKEFAKKALADRAGLESPQAKAVEINLILLDRLTRASNDTYYGKFKFPDNWKPVSHDALMDGSYDRMDVIAKHVAIMRKAENTRDKWNKKYQITQVSSSSKKTEIKRTAIAQELKNGNPDFSKFTMPGHEEVRHHLKGALGKVPDAERATIEAKIKATHDQTHHGGFGTKVHNVFRITHLPGEEKFQQIDTARNNTDFYYHGAPTKIAQKIIGVTGGFAVPKSAANGRMLGDGVYLASESSKSAQYINGFSRARGERGVLFLCKASLGKVEESTRRDSLYNTKALKKKGVDTLYMGRPHVLNPEWAVKDASAVIPRLWIDCEKV